MDNKSEIAHLREQIELEHAASVWALTGLAAGNAQHEFISARFQRMDAYHRQLSQLIGEEPTIAFVCEVFEKSPLQTQS